MSGLGHYFEHDGVASVLISLVREHTEKIRSPRALWVPFEMGRPLGVPGDVPFQTRVVMSALQLLESTDGPILEDFPDDVPKSIHSNEMTQWVCPVSFPAPTPIAGNEPDPYEAALEEDRLRFTPWYELAVERKGSTSVGSSGIEIKGLSKFIAAFFSEPLPQNPRPEVPLADMLIFACDDLRAYILEAVTAQPGYISSEDLALWFWQKTVTGAVMLKLKNKCLESDNLELVEIATRFAPDHIAAIVEK